MTDAKSANLLQAHLTDLKSSDPANVNRGLRAVFKGVARVVSKHYGYKTVSANGTQTAVPQEQVHQDSDGTFNLVMKIVFVLLAMIIILGILFGGGHGGSGGSGHGWPWLWLLWLLGMSGNDRNRNVGGWGGPGGFGGGGFGGGSSGGGGASV
ncbi:hypothetical protein [Lacticaseibacillus thailandensis]|nr:hypothetical protein [Lacticaseibacillus thailandensis]